MRRLDHKSLVAFVHIVIQLIKADHIIDASEVRQLELLEQQYGFDRHEMAEAQRLSLSEAVSRLAQLEPEVRSSILASLSELAGADRQCVPGEALLLVALRYCLELQEQDCELLPSTDASDTLSPYVLYIENERDAEVHCQLETDLQLLRLQLQLYGFRLLFIEDLVSQLAQLDQPLLQKVLGYMSPQLDDVQLQQIFSRIRQMDTSTFCTHVLVRGQQLTSLRQSAPSLLIHLGSAYLRIGLSQGVTPTVRQFLAE